MEDKDAQIEELRRQLADSERTQRKLEGDVRATQVERNRLKTERDNALEVSQFTQDELEAEHAKNQELQRIADGLRDSTIKEVIPPTRNIDPKDKSYRMSAIRGQLTTKDHTKIGTSNNESMHSVFCKKLKSAFRNEQMAHITFNSDIQWDAWSNDGG